MEYEKFEIVLELNIMQMNERKNNILIEIELMKIIMPSSLSPVKYLF